MAVLLVRIADCRLVLWGSVPDLAGRGAEMVWNATADLDDQWYQRYVIFFLLFVFSLCERKNEQQMKWEVPCCRRQSGG